MPWYSWLCLISSVALRDTFTIPTLPLVDAFDQIDNQKIGCSPHEGIVIVECVNALSYRDGLNVPFNVDFPRAHTPLNIEFPRVRNPLAVKFVTTR